MTDIDAIISDLERAFIEAVDVLPAREPGWFDLLEAKELLGCSESGAYARLRKAVAMGKMETMRVIDGSKVKNVWRPITADTYDETDGGTCLDCGTKLDIVRPGKWQCPKCE